jgi:NDP-sugar pyrophosphorylase family protein
MSVPCHALVLTAGVGTRLRPLTYLRAKPALPVAGEPLIRRIIRWLVSSSVTELVLNLHHLPETLTRVVGDSSDLSARVRYAWEHPDILGSAGGPRQAWPIMGVDSFLIVNGDTLTDLDLRPLAAAHARSGALVTLALVPNRDPRRYGGVCLDADGVVSGFVPRGVAREGSFHFIGAQLVDAKVFRTVPAGRPANSIGGVYDEVLSAHPGAIRGHVCDATFWDIGTAEDYLAASLACEQADRFGAGPLHPAPKVDPSARVTRSIVWDEVDISRGCEIEACIITDRVRLPPGSVYRHAVVMRADSVPPTAGGYLDGDLRVLPLSFGAESAAGHDWARRPQP